MLKSSHAASRLLVLGPSYHVSAFFALVGDELRIGAELGKAACKPHDCATMCALGPGQCTVVRRFHIGLRRVAICWRTIECGCPIGNSGNIPKENPQARARRVLVVLTSSFFEQASSALAGICLRGFARRNVTRPSARCNAHSSRASAPVDDDEPGQPRWTGYVPPPPISPSSTSTCSASLIA
jgi:hypothetical protein